MAYEVYSAGDSIGEFGVFQDAIECAEDEMNNLWADENGDAELVQVHLICSSTGLYDRGSKDKDGNTTLDYEHHTTSEWDRILSALASMDYLDGYLPITHDKKPVYPGMKLYLVIGISREVFRFTVNSIECGEAKGEYVVRGWDYGRQVSVCEDPSECFSSLESTR
ncbi:hypothetical protein Pan241w_10980 [Gimesia alba]|uniref:Uncharacterized protein n=1 Tax=Gimesia alba TaxID=2527973 RepID=A0A517RAY0_9PLAN|nr:hypothetical protein [Gimesia alba]QDT41039.1 hypothetical protein Pan241w_10980 [Gimesia alba]